MNAECLETSEFEKESWELNVHYFQLSKNFYLAQFAQSDIIVTVAPSVAGLHSLFSCEVLNGSLQKEI